MQFTKVKMLIADRDKAMAVEITDWAKYNADYMTFSSAESLADLLAEIRNTSKHYDIVVVHDTFRDGKFSHWLRDHQWELESTVVVLYSGANAGRERIWNPDIHVLFRGDPGEPLRTIRHEFENALRTKLGDE